MRQSIARQRSRKEFLLPVFVLGFLFIHLAFLPAHGLASHFMMIPSPDTHASSLLHSVEEEAPANHEGAGTSPSDSSHEHEHDGTPSCHADPNYAFAAPGRSFTDKLSDPGSWALAATAALLLALFALPPERDTCQRRWPTRPPWRPAGAELLTHVCISRV